MFKAKCKCIDCEHRENGIYFQRNECYNRIRLEIAQAITAAEETKDLDLYSWLKELYTRIHMFEKYYSRRKEKEKATDSNAET